MFSFLYSKYLVAKSRNLCCCCVFIKQRRERAITYSNQVLVAELQELKRKGERQRKIIRASIEDSGTNLITCICVFQIFSVQLIYGPFVIHSETMAY